VIHPSSAIAGDCALGEGVEIGPFCVLGIDGPEAPLDLVGGTLRSHVVLYRGTTIGAGFHAGHHVLVREHTTIGASVSIGSGSIVEHHVTIGDRVRIHSRCFVPEHSVLEEGAWLGPGVTVTNARYPNRPDTKANLEGVTVEAGAVVGAAAVLLPGVRLGRGCLIGAGAVVVRDVAAGETVVGNPARVIR
jgi:acetyltransferase-like isoleucine patch superfamily enzyme